MNLYAEKISIKEKSTLKRNPNFQTGLLGWGQRVGRVWFSMRWQML